MRHRVKYATQLKEKINRKRRVKKLLEGKAVGMQTPDWEAEAREQAALNLLSRDIPALPAPSPLFAKTNTSIGPPKLRKPSRNSKVALLPLPSSVTSTPTFPFVSTPTPPVSPSLASSVNSTATSGTPSLSSHVSASLQNVITAPPISRCLPLCSQCGIGGIILRDRSGRSQAFKYWNESLLWSKLVRPLVEPVWEVQIASSSRSGHTPGKPDMTHSIPSLPMTATCLRLSTY